MPAQSLLLSLLGLCAIVGIGKVTCQTCHQDWQYFQHSCYSFGEDKVPWGDAQAICKASNAKLAEIETNAENNFLKNIARNKEAIDIWLGGTDIFHEGRWVWSSTNQLIQFVDWPRGEPSDPRPGSEDCLSFSSGRNYRWNDYNCTKKAQFLCESSALSTGG